MQLSIANPEQRTADILASLRSTFAQKGFDGASMQDLARAAGMSAGNFYRYFPSKAAIIRGLIAADMAQMGQDFETVICSATPMDDLRAILRVKINDHQCTLDGCLWAEIHAISMRNREIGAILATMEEHVTAFFVQIFALQTGLSQQQAHAAYAPKAALIIALFRGAVMIGSPNTAVNTATTQNLIALIDQALDSIASPDQKV